MTDEEKDINESASSNISANLETSENKSNTTPTHENLLGELLEIDYSDGRLPGQYKSIYPEDARRIYIKETRFYTLVLFLALCFLFGLLLALVIFEKRLEEYYGEPFLLSGLNKSYLAASLYRLVVIFVSGITGGALFALRNVSKLIFLRYWHEDRILWRISFPFIGGIVAIFLALLNIGGILAPFRKEQFYSLSFCAGYGFIVGYFSDSVLRALSRIAGDFLENIRFRESKQSSKRKE